MEKIAIILYFHLKLTLQKKHQLAINQVEKFEEKKKLSLNPCYKVSWCENGRMTLRENNSNGKEATRSRLSWRTISRKLVTWKVFTCSPRKVTVDHNRANDIDNSEMIIYNNKQ